MSKIETVVNDLERVKRELQVVLNNCADVAQEDWLIEQSRTLTEEALLDVSQALVKANRAYRLAQSHQVAKTIFERDWSDETDSTE